MEEEDSIINISYYSQRSIQFSIAENTFQHFFILKYYSRLEYFTSRKTIELKR